MLHGLIRISRLAALALCGALQVFATTVVPPEFPTLVNDSDCIVHAVTRSVVAEKRPSARGFKIVTRVELEVLEAVAGTPPAKLTLEFLGGRVGDESVRVEGMPQFKVGDEDILFVSGNGQSICPLYAMMHGRYPVRLEAATGRKYVARADGTPLQNTAQISSPLAETAGPRPGREAVASAPGLTPAAFVQQIKASVRPDARFNRAKN